jgi:hypothetical protein
MPRLPHPLGRIVATPAALELLERAGQHPLEVIRRHASGDWGSIGADSVTVNEESIRLQHGTVLSTYSLVAETILVATSMGKDETYTTVMLPEEW